MAFAFIPMAQERQAPAFARRQRVERVTARERRASSPMLPRIAFSSMRARRAASGERHVQHDASHVRTAPVYICRPPFTFFVLARSRRVMQLLAALQMPARLHVRVCA